MRLADDAGLDDSDGGSTVRDLTLLGDLDLSDLGLIDLLLRVLDRLLLDE